MADYNGGLTGLAGELKEYKFDPEGDGYDYDTASRVGKPRINPEDNKLHWFSLNQGTGMVLKGRQHPTWNKMMEAEDELGNEVYLNESDGRYYSRKKKKK